MRLCPARFARPVGLLPITPFGLFVPATAFPSQHAPGIASAAARGAVPPTNGNDSRNGTGTAIRAKG
jgi:hypothetical protein